MDIIWAVVTIAVVVALLGVAAWTFVIAPFVVPRRQLR